MSPKVREDNTEMANKNEGVLGVVVDSQVSISPIGGSHNYVTNEKLDLLNENLYTFSTTIIAREAGTYSKPIIRISNSTEEESTFTFALKSEDPSSSRIGILHEDTNYVLRDDAGIFYNPQVTISSGEYVDLFLQVHDEFDVNYNEDLVIKLVQN